MKIKTLLVAFAAAACTIFAAGCSDSPSDVVENFVDATEDVDFAEAKEYCTGSMREGLAFAEEMFNKLSDDEQDKLIKKEKKNIGEKYDGFKIVSEDIDGDNATVKFENAEGEEGTAKLKKVDGKWKISFMR